MVPACLLMVCANEISVGSPRGFFLFNTSVNKEYLRRAHCWPIAFALIREISRPYQTATVLLLIVLNRMRSWVMATRLYCHSLETEWMLAWVAIRLQVITIATSSKKRALPRSYLVP